MKKLDIELLLNDFRLTTAEILYRLPDYPVILQTYLWQDYDKTPDFPTLRKFLDFWDRELEGKLHSVTIASCELIKPADIRLIKQEFHLDSRMN